MSPKEPNKLEEDEEYERARHSMGGATRNVTLSCLGLDLQNSWQIYP